MYHGKKNRAHKKRKNHYGRFPVETKIDKEKKTSIKCKGGGTKTKIVSTEYANVIVDGKAAKCKIISFEENPVSQDYSRRHIITKGAIITVKTPDKKEIKARVSSRPGQSSSLNAISL
ncbi:MAG: 30S ribosomal protein S8e [Candidatus Altiarchaeales archaeon ex4484_96]|nr:MAG: 30S ribosomal protein S8e [Candidatus Altiarchaeales archaeon ex4484_96]